MVIRGLGAERQQKEEESCKTKREEPAAERVKIWANTVDLPSPPWFMLLVVAKSNKILKLFPMYTEKKTENNWKLEFNLAPAEHRGKVPAFYLHW